MKRKINTIINLLIINLKIFYYIFFSKKKIIFFFNPKKKLANITNYYIKDWLSQLKKDFYVIYAYVPGEYFNYNDEIKISPIACKYIFGVDIFISTYVCEYFSNNSKKIYIHHDIYDTPLTKKENFKELIGQLLKYDYIFTPSKISKNMFENLFINSVNKPEIISTGYLKLDYLLKKQKKNKLKKNSIIIAPTDFNAFKKYSLLDKLPELISEIISKSNLQIIFRPHPSNRDNKKILNIKKKFNNSKKFVFDTSENYLNNYNKSFCMITDISGTAYTYSFLNETPVIFLTNKIVEKNLKTYNYIKDRKKIGYIAESINELLKKIKLIKRNKNKFKRSIIKLKYNLSNLKNVKKVMTDKVYDIVLKNEVST